MTDGGEKVMELIRTKLRIGAEKPFTVAHMTDTHLTYADLRDGERKVTLARERAKGFPQGEAVLNFGCETAKKLGIPLVHTGDLMDFVSLANLERVKRFTDENDCFMATGNHEFSLYVGEAREDAAYRNRSLPAVQAVFKNNIRMSARVMGGVNFVALDNGSYLFEEEQLIFLKKEAEKGLPMVLLLHTPLYEEPLYERVMQTAPCAYLVAVPEERMRMYPAHRFEQQRADGITLRTVEYIREEPLIKALVTGHLHFNYEGLFAGRIPQIVTSCVDVRLLEIE